MGRLSQMGANLRRAYEVSRATVRAARERPETRLEASTLATRPTPPTPPTGPPPEVADASGSGPPDDMAVPRGLRIAASWSWRVIVIGLVVYALLWLVSYFMLLVAPLLIALLLAGLLMPAQRALLWLGIHRSLAALLVVIAGLAAVGGTLTLVINQFIAGLDDLIKQVEGGIGQIQDWLITGPFGLTDDALQTAIGEVQQWMSENTGQLTQGALSAVTGVVQFLTGMVFAIVVLFFFLRDGSRIWRFILGLMPMRARAPMAYAGEGAWGSLSGYVRATVLVALVDAVGIGVGLWILSHVMTFPVGLVLPIAALVFLSAFIPIVGAFVSGAVAVLVGLVSGETPALGVVQALIVLGIVVVVQQLESNVLQPFIVSKMVRIHPLAVLIAVLAGILLAGIIGALVAVPLVAVINTMVRRLHAFHHRPPPEQVADGDDPEPSPQPDGENEIDLDVAASPAHP